MNNIEAKVDVPPTSEEKIAILTSLGYRRINDRMLKPFGYKIYIYMLDSDRISNHFYGHGTATGLLCYDSEKMEGNNAEDFAWKIIDFEQYKSRNDGVAGRPTNFGFMSAKEQIELMI